MLKTVLVEPKQKRALHTEDVMHESHVLHGDEVFMVVTDLETAHGTFKNVSQTTAGTYNITTPEASGSVMVTDLVLNTEKQTGGEVEVIFTDDTRSITLFKAYCNDAPANLVLPTNGRLQGWQDARIDLVVTANTDCSVTLGYVKMPAGLPYDEWDSLR